MTRTPSVSFVFSSTEFILIILRSWNIFWEIVWKIILNSFFRDDREEINKLAQEIQQKLRYSGQEAVCCFSVIS